MEEFEIVEKQAINYAIQNYGTEDVVQSNLLQAISKESFQAGAKWGIEHEWHDLRKCPDDLPKCAENKQILFYVKEFYTDIGKDTSHFCLGFYAKSFLNDDIKVFVEKSKGYECEHPSQEVIAWCELLTYKE